MDLALRVSRLHTIKNIQRKIYVLAGHHIEIYVCQTIVSVKKKNHIIHESS